MPTTTNYGWTTPADTDLVKDGAAAIRTLGSSIDSTLKTQIDAQIPDSLLTTKGDLIAATGASTPARLAVGSNDQVLMADSTTATGLKWATSASGGMTLLSTTTLSGASTTVSSINQGYTNLYVVFQDTVGNTNTTFLIRFNSDTGTNYRTQGAKGGGGTISVDSGSDDGVWFYDGLGSSSTAGNPLSGFLSINNYTSTGTKPLEFSARVTRSDNRKFYIASGIYFGGSAISSMTFVAENQSFTAGTVRIYGVK